MFVVWVDMLRIWPTKETCWTQLIQMMMMKHYARIWETYLCDFDVINLEFCVWMRLLGFQNLLDGDGSKSVFAICSLPSKSANCKGVESV